jgi:hypothetical protein
VEQLRVSPGVQLSALESPSLLEPQAITKPTTTISAEANFAIFMVSL